jgi:predicted methyltransferase
MVVLRALRWLAICCLAGCAARGSDAAAPRPAVAPVAPTAATASPAAAEPPAVAPRILVPPAELVLEDVEPPPAAPEAASPPCPSEPRRDEHQKPDHVVALMELSEAMTVVDLGSGNGYFLCRLSRAVGVRGRVVATEIGKKLVRALKKRVASEQLPNVDVLQAPANDVGVAPGTADRILLVNVWHHLPNRKRYATRVARALSPGGKVVIVDFMPAGRRGTHGIMPERVIAELAAGGIDGTLVADDLPEQYVIVGSRRAPDDARTP